VVIISQNKVDLGVLRNQLAAALVTVKVQALV
jgi:hypothetical protein